MIFYLFTSNPSRLKLIPSTHRYRRISQIEFRNLARYLEIYRESGEVTVSGTGLDGIVLSRILKPVGIEIRTSSASPGLYKHDELPPLAPNDYVLVCFPKIYGFYIQHAYQNASDARFKEIVETGIVEPVDARATERVKLKSIAQEMVALDKRIELAEMLVQKAELEGEGEREENEDDGIVAMSNAKKLLDEYLAEREELLRNESLSDLAKVEETLSLCKRDRIASEEKIKETTLRLEIETNVNDNSESRERLDHNLKALRNRLELYDETIEGLSILAKELHKKKSDARQHSS